jgi:hypothetical protein
MVVLGMAAALSVAVLDLILTGGPGLLFDLAYVALCVALALRVRPADFFTVGVLPPLLMLGVFWVLGLVTPGSIADEGVGTLQALLTGLANHATALAVGYALCLACLAIRRTVLQSSKRSGSPAPRRRSVGVPSE